MLFLKAGILTTIQDLGRNGYRSLGINPNGAMDKYAMRSINILLGNNENEAVLEMHFPAPEILFEADTIITIGGADFSPMIDNQLVMNQKMYFVKMGSVLKFQKKNKGERAYLAIKGGFEIEKWLDSASTNLVAKIGGKKVEKGDRISLKINIETGFKTFSRISISASLFGNKNQKEIRIIAGNEFQFLTKESRQSLENQYFTISKEANRMGYKLASNPLETSKRIELLSSAVDFGTVQLLPNGQLIILMADHQTTGGYPRIGNVILVDLPILAQKSVGESFKFKIISIEEAEALFLENERNLMRLKVGISLLK